MKLFVANLSPRITKESLGNLFGKYGAINNLEVSYLKRAGSKSGTAILEMNPRDALAAIAALNGQPCSNRRLYITVMDSKFQTRKVVLSRSATGSPS